MNDQAVYSLAIQALEEKRDRAVAFGKPTANYDEAIERLMAMKNLSNFLDGFAKPKIELRFEENDEKHTGNSTDQ